MLSHNKILVKKNLFGHKKNLVTKKLVTKEFSHKTILVK